MDGPESVSSITFSFISTNYMKEKKKSEKSVLIKEWETQNIKLLVKYKH